jgi:shikimate dehydrogenase
MERVVALIGSPVGQSLSPRMQNAAFAARGLDWTYVACEVGAGEVAEAVRGLPRSGSQGRT